MENKKPKTLVLVCRQDFCRVLDRMLRSEGLSNFQHGDLSLVSGPVIEAMAGGATEVFVVSTDADHAGRLISLLRACPIRGEAEEIFELYIVGED
ncbi:MAG TPA: hypothetical protein VNN73_03555 [Blastocatellia bacterium]|nr:hypothetical protein [Blastocatellia bacterium]